MLDNWQTADVSSRLRAALSFIDKLVRSPAAVDARDIQALRRADVSVAAIRDIAYVCGLFSTIVRIADALNWDIPSSFVTSRQSLVRFGYRLPPLL